MPTKPDLSPFTTERDRLEQWLASHNEAENEVLHVSVRVMRDHFDILIKAKGKMTPKALGYMALARDHMKIEFEKSHRER